MLRNILSITGRPGLFKIVSHGSRMLVVEDIVSGKRMPVHARDKVVSLGDIAMYTEGEDRPLSEILTAVREKNGGEKIDIKAISDNDSLRARFAEIVPDYDRDRVYPSDIRKLFTWYNQLIAAGVTEFKEKEIAQDQAAEAAEAADEAATTK